MLYFRHGARYPHYYQLINILGALRRQKPEKFLEHKPTMTEVMSEVFTPTNGLDQIET